MAYAMKKMPAAEAERGGRQADVGAEFVLGEAQVDAVHVVRHEHDEEERDHAAEDLADGGLYGGGMHLGDFGGHERLRSWQGRERGNGFTSGARTG